MQKKTLALCLVLMFATLVNGFQSATEWVTYTSVEGRYSVLVPLQPELSSQETATSSGTKLPQYLATSTASDGQYTVVYFDATPNTIEFSFDKGRDGMLKGFRGTLLSEAPITLGKYAGREVKISANDGSGTEFIIRVRYYVVETGVYALQHVYRKADADAVAMKTTKFFDSFKVTAK